MGKGISNRKNNETESGNKISSLIKTRKGLPKGGQGSPGFWREYTIDLIMTLNETEQWDDDDLHDETDQKRLNNNHYEGYCDDELSRENLE